jgi:hypothetical protein
VNEGGLGKDKRNLKQELKEQVTSKRQWLDTSPTGTPLHNEDLLSMSFWFKDQIMVYVDLPKAFQYLSTFLHCIQSPWLQELANQDTIRALKLEHSKEITKLRQEFELQAKELQQKYEVTDSF